MAKVEINLMPLAGLSIYLNSAIDRLNNYNITPVRGAGLLTPLFCAQLPNLCRTLNSPPIFISIRNKLLSR